MTNLCIGSVLLEAVWRYRYSTKNHEKWFSEPDTEPENGLDTGSTKPVHPVRFITDTL